MDYEEITAAIRLPLKFKYRDPANRPVRKNGTYRGRQNVKKKLTIWGALEASLKKRSKNAPANQGKKG